MRGLLVLTLAAAMSVARAQERDAARAVEGVVFGSLALTPLANAAVQLATEAGASPRMAFSTVTDPRGRFRFEHVSPGSSLATFSHPLLDSLGIEPVVRRVEGAERARRVGLAVPSAARLIHELCPAGALGDSSAIFLGHVRDARTGSARPRASVMVRWLEYTLGSKGFVAEQPTVSVESNDAGWFAICNLPVGVDLIVHAAAGADTSGPVAMQVPWRGVAHRELFVGAGERVSAAAERGEGGGLAAWRGDARVHGRVSTAGEVPVRGAELQAGGTAAHTRSTETGSFTLTELPLGSQTFEVRALGYIPERFVVDIHGDEAADSLELRPSAMEQRVRMHGGMGELCSPTVYIDGVRYNESNDDLSVSNIDLYSWPRLLHGVEVYTRAVDVPGQFHTMNDCGAVIVWTSQHHSLAPPRRRQQ